MSLDVKNVSAYYKYARYNYSESQQRPVANGEVALNWYCGSQSSLFYNSVCLYSKFTKGVLGFVYDAENSDIFDKCFNVDSLNSLIFSATTEVLDNDSIYDRKVLSHTTPSGYSIVLNFDLCGSAYQRSNSSR